MRCFFDSRDRDCDDVTRSGGVGTGANRQCLPERIFHVVLGSFLAARGRQFDNESKSNARVQALLPRLESASERWRD